jgi:hypothetical protein
MREAMTEDKFFERLRDDAGHLRYEPRDAFVWARLTARVREAIRRPADVSQMLARWFRPIAAAFLLLAVGAGVTVSWVERTQSTYAVESIASHPVEITVDGDTFSFTE